MISEVPRNEKGLARLIKPGEGQTLEFKRFSEQSGFLTVTFKVQIVAGGDSGAARGLVEKVGRRVGRYAAKDSRPDARESGDFQAGTGVHYRGQYNGDRQEHRVSETEEVGPSSRSRQGWTLGGGEVNGIVRAWNRGSNRVIAAGGMVRPESQPESGTSPALVWYQSSVRSKLDGSKEAGRDMCSCCHVRHESLHPIGAQDTMVKIDVLKGMVGLVRMPEARY